MATTIHWLAKHFSRFPHKVWPTHCGGIDRDFVSPSPEEFANFVGGVNPPPTVSGIKIRCAVRWTTSMMILRFHAEAVMSRKTSSSAPLLVVELGCLHRVAGITQVE